MPNDNAERLSYWGGVFAEHRARLLGLASRSLNPILLRRVSVEDVVQDALAAACERIGFFESNPEVPVYFKLRMILLQTVAGLERKHLQCGKRDAYKEVEVAEEGDGTAAGFNWNMFASSVTSPVSKLARADRYVLLQQALEALPENDRQVLTLRHFDGMSNQDCAEVLGIAPKAASIRYVRALERLQGVLSQLTEFKP